MSPLVRRTLKLGVDENLRIGRRLASLLPLWMANQTRFSH